MEHFELDRVEACAGGEKTLISLTRRSGSGKKLAVSPATGLATLIGCWLPW